MVVGKFHPTVEEMISLYSRKTKYIEENEIYDEQRIFGME